MSDWCDRDQARALWADAPTDDDLLDLILESAQESCESYAPALADLEPVPFRYTQAVAFQARDSWNGGQGAVTDVDGLVIVPRRMSAQVRALLRPPRPPIGVG